MNLIAASAFTTGSPAVRATGLDVTMDVFQVALADMTVTKIVDAQAATEWADGLYGYLVEDVDLTLYSYYWAAHTDDSSVNAQDMYAAFVNLSPQTAQALDASGIRGAVGLVNPNLDTQLGEIQSGLPVPPDPMVLP